MDSSKEEIMAYLASTQTFDQKVSTSLIAASHFLKQVGLAQLRTEPGPALSILRTAITLKNSLELIARDFIPGLSEQIEQDYLDEVADDLMRKGII